MMRDRLALETLLEARVAEGDARACASLLLAQTDQTRRSLTLWVERMLTKQQQLRPDGETPDGRARRIDAARLIALATLDESDLTPYLGAYLPSSRDLADLVCDVVAARWREGSRARASLAERIYTMPSQWPLSCRLEERGLAPPPAPSARILSFICGASSEPTPLLELLRARSELRSFVWLLFDSQTAGDALLVHDREHGDRRFVDAIVALANDGLLARGRLLDRTLDVLATSGEHAAWFAELHEGLAPSVGEQRARTDAYARLLSCRSDPAFGVGRRAIVALLRAGAIAPERLTTTFENALDRANKATLRRLLRLLDEAAQRSAAAGAIAVLAVAGLRRESADDQAAVLRVLERHAKPSEEALVARLREVLPYVAASNRERVTKLLGDSSRAAQDVATLSTHDEPSLRARARALPEAWARPAGVESALRALEAGSASIEPLALDPLCVPRLHSPVEPIHDLDELVDASLVAIEGKASADDLERVLDGIARLCRLRPDDFEARTAPLRHRCTDRITEGLRGPIVNGLPFIGYSSLHDLMGVILAWLEGVGDRPAKWSGPTRQWLPKQVTAAEAHEARTRIARTAMASVMLFHSGRLALLARRVADGVVAPLLSTPTHRGGFIDPVVLARRAATHAPTDRADAMIALLRLAPEHRAEAREAASHVPGELGAALRHALGASEAIGPDAALWYAAARARSPLGDDPAVEARHPHGGPDAAMAARYAIDQTCFPNLERGAGMALVHEEKRVIATEPKLPESLYGDRFPTVWHATRLARFGGAPTAWETSLWPMRYAAVFAREAAHLSYFIESEGTYWQGDWEPLFDPDTSLELPGALHVALGLAARHPTQNKLAEDALVAAIDEGRVSAVELGSAMGAVLRWGAIRLTRWVRAFRQVAALSALHRHFVLAAVAHALGEASPAPAVARPLLALLREWVIESGEPIPDLRCREWLGTIGGSGKAASAARALLGPSPTDPTLHRRSAALRVLANRIERAERWSAAARASASAHPSTQRRDTDESAPPAPTGDIAG